MSELDSEEHLKKLEETKELALKALSRYDEPTMSLEEIREMLNRKLGDISLSEFIIKERESQW